MFGAKWIDKTNIDIILKHYPESDFDVYVVFSDNKSDKPLRECTGKETNVDRIVVSYKDGTNKVDPDPYIFYVTGPFDIAYFLTMLERPSYFSVRCKNRKLYPQTRNEDPEEILRMRTAVREKFVHYMEMSDIDVLAISEEAENDQI